MSDETEYNEDQVVIVEDCDSEGTKTKALRQALGMSVGVPITFENPRLAIVTHPDLDEGQEKWLVATHSEWQNIRHQLVFDQLLHMGIDLLSEYILQDMSPEETKPIIMGILMAPEDTISSYTKNRCLSLILNFESLLRDFSEDEDIEGSGVYRVKVKTEDGSMGGTIHIASTSLSKEEKVQGDRLTAEIEAPLQGSVET